MLKNDYLVVNIGVDVGCQHWHAGLTAVPICASLPPAEIRSRAAPLSDLLDIELAAWLGARFPETLLHEREREWEALRVPKA